MALFGGKEIRYNKEKNALLLNSRGISFDEIAQLIEEGIQVSVVNHPNIITYPKQKLIVANIYGYPWAIPYVEEDEYIFLKTAYPAREFKYLMESL